ncbi:MAG: I78 family peptidase inhibitor [Pseudomonadota bacterium]
MQRTSVLMAGLTSLLLGCALGGGDGEITDASCGADELSSTVGEQIQDLAAASFTAEVTRFINPGDAVTSDVRPERLNIVLDAEGRVVEVYCG